MLTKSPVPRRKARKTALGCLGMLLLPVVFLGSCGIAFAVGQRVVVSSVYGSEEYTSGLRVVGRHGELSDGRRLPSGWFAFLSIGSFVASLPVVVAYVAVLRAYDLWPDDETGGAAS